MKQLSRNSCKLQVNVNQQLIILASLLDFLRISFTIAIIINLATLKYKRLLIRGVRVSRILQIDTQISILVVYSKYLVILIYSEYLVVFIDTFRLFSLGSKQLSKTSSSNTIVGILISTRRQLIIYNSDRQINLEYIQYLIQQKLVVRGSYIDTE